MSVPRWDVAADGVRHLFEGTEGASMTSLCGHPEAGTVAPLDIDGRRCSTCLAEELSPARFCRRCGRRADDRDKLGRCEGCR
jgi:hypothetical protein